MRQADATRLRATLMVAAAASSWGCWSLFLRPSGLSAWETAPILFLVVGLALLPFLRVDRPAPIQWDRTTALLLAANALFDCVNVVAFFAALGTTTVGVAVLTHYAAPLIVALLAPLVDREHVKGSISAAAVATCGLALVLRPWQAPEHGVVLGALLGLLSAGGYAANVFTLRRLQQRIGAARTMSWHSLIAVVVFVPFADYSALQRVGVARLALVVAGSLLLGVAGGWLFLRGLGVVGSTRAAVIAFLEPLVAVVVGWLAWDERIGWL